MKPNMLVIMSDEHQGAALGCAGHPFVKTPHLDALAGRGMRFTDAYTPSPICVPARAAFATGRPVHETRCWDNAMPYRGTPQGWGHVLQAAGVPVESIGKLHYRSIEDPSGFDHQTIPMHVLNGIGMLWGSLRREGERAPSPAKRMLGETIGPGESSYTRYDADVTEQSCDWLTRRAGHQEPWCLYVGLVAPHFPLVCPPEFYDLYADYPFEEPKLSVRHGYQRHPWVEQQNALMNTEAAFEDDEERRRAMAAYFGLISWMDHNVGRILGALDAAGLAETTQVIYTSDHGDNVGARGLWGKSCFYQESVHVPLIMAGPSIEQGACATPVDLLDVAASIPNAFDLPFDGAGTPLQRIARAPDDLDRPILSQYHAIGSVSGGFMLRKGHWKLIHYVGFDPELFDLVADPEELINLAAEPAYADALADMQNALREQLDPDAVNAQAFADQDALIASYGGREAALKIGAPGATPPPKSN